MKIYSINPIAFTAKNNIRFTKENFYSQINDYLNNKCDKNEYLKKFNSGVKKIIKQQSNAEYNPVEKRYINNLIDLLDTKDGALKLPDNFLRSQMLELLKYRK